jgi:hypothetical protein
MQQYLTPQRMPHETYEEYVVRRCSGNYYVEDICKGRMFYATDEHSRIKHIDDKGKPVFVGIPYVKEKVA